MRGKGLCPGGDPPPPTFVIRLSLLFLSPCLVSVEFEAPKVLGTAASEVVVGSIFFGGEECFFLVRGRTKVS